ncbi:DUF6111 family protein [Indioceanicola profundi]|uniref:DUF6111 family protein n=1 Tax=Indioceanicola profundi TaxID=2220096 RepID=UPI000E6AAEF0|nr:DUF6111 family protein [Indioceanicola profundi]
MLRVLLTILIPLLLPTLVYVGYLVLTGRRAAVGRGGEPAADVPWVWLLAAGIGLMAAFLVSLALLGGHGTDSLYIPAHVGPDGQTVPARVIPADQLPREAAPAEDAAPQ